MLQINRCLLSRRNQKRSFNWEAIVINNKNLQEEFGFHLKQKGAMLAKGRLLGIQFQGTFKRRFVLGIGSMPIFKPKKIKEAFQEIGADFLAETDTNQIFPILENSQIEKLSEQFDFLFGKNRFRKSAIRIIFLGYLWCSSR